MDNLLMEVLHELDVSTLTHNEWVSVGMALKEEGYPVDVWDEWSRDDSRYHPGECARRWNSFGGATNPVTGGTIVQMAKDHGVWPPAHYSSAGCLAWDDVIDVDDEPVHEATRTPAEDLILYLETLFEPNEHVSYVTDAFLGEDDRWKPGNAGYSDRTAGELIEALKRHSDDIGAVLGDWKPEAGAWIRFNPMDGEGVKNDNVARFAYALVESDTMSIPEQIERYQRLQLPIAALVSSAGKSVHAIVRIDAPDKIEYDRRVGFLYEFLEKHGVSIDKQNRNPSRLSRLPGATRNGKPQKLLGVNMGHKSWANWREWAESDSDDLPPIIRMIDVIDNPPPLAEALIEGVLRRGHKMLVSSDSKAGKSFMLMNLALSFASGEPWLGFKVQKGRVLYVNFEISESSAIHRIIDICDARRLPHKCVENLELWNLRGRACTLEAFVPKLLRRVKGTKLDAIIIDPIYKVIMGDENNASDMGKFCNQFDRICEATGCSCIYAHHHSKGAQGGKKAMDRASGSGVFARDPDAQLDISLLAMPPEQRESLRPKNCPKATPWRMEGTLREFESFEPVDFWFTHPTYMVDENLRSFGVEGSPEAASSLASAARSDVAENRYVTAWYEVSEETESDWVSAQQLAKNMGITRRAVSKYIDAHPDLFETSTDNITIFYRLRDCLI